MTVRVPGYTLRNNEVTVPRGTVVLLELRIPAGDLLVMDDLDAPSLAIADDAELPEGVSTSSLAPVRIDLPDGFTVDQDDDSSGAELFGEDNGRQRLSAAEVVSGQRNISTASIDRFLRVEVIAQANEGDYEIAVRGLAGYQPVRVAIADTELVTPLEPVSQYTPGTSRTEGGPVLGANEPFLHVYPFHLPSGSDDFSWDNTPLGGTIHYPGDTVAIRVTVGNSADAAGNNTIPLPDGVQDNEGFFDGPAVARDTTCGVYVPSAGVAANRIDVAVHIEAANANTALAIAHLHTAEPAYFDIFDDFDYVTYDPIGWYQVRTTCGHSWNDDRRLVNEDTAEDTAEVARFVEGGGEYNFTFTGRIMHGIAQAATEAAPVLSALPGEGADQ